MKLETIVIGFSRRGDKASILERAFNSINDFQTKIKLMRPYKELKEIYDEFQTQRQKELENLIDQRCKEENKTREELGNKLPNDLIPVFQQKLNELLRTDVEIKNKPEFDLQQLGESDLTVPELIELESFLKQQGE